MALLVEGGHSGLHLELNSELIEILSELKLLLLAFLFHVDNSVQMPTDQPNAHQAGKHAQIRGLGTRH